MNNDFNFKGEWNSEFLSESLVGERVNFFGWYFFIVSIFRVFVSFLIVDN